MICQHIEIEEIRDVMRYKLPDVEALVSEHKMM